MFDANPSLYHAKAQRGARIFCVDSVHTGLGAGTKTHARSLLENRAHHADEGSDITKTANATELMLYDAINTPTLLDTLCPRGASPHMRREEWRFCVPISLAAEQAKE